MLPRRTNGGGPRSHIHVRYNQLQAMGKSTRIEVGASVTVSIKIKKKDSKKGVTERNLMKGISRKRLREQKPTEENLPSLGLKGRWRERCCQREREPWDGVLGRSWALEAAFAARLEGAGWWSINTQSLFLPML